MKNEIKILIVAAICLAIIPSTVFAFGEVTGPVVIYAPVGGSGVGQWGLVNNETVTLQLRIEGDAAKYISLPSEVTLQPTGIYWVNVTANIPSNYDKSQGTNITGDMFALREGTPGQVQINLQLEKHVYILVDQTAPSTSSAPIASAPVQSVQNNLFSGFSFLPVLDFNLVGAIVVGIVIFLAFVFISRRFGFRQVETKVKPQRKRR